MKFRTPHSEKKIAIIGAGFVGSTAAYTIMMDGAARQIALIDQDKSKAEGHALDLMHGIQFAHSTQIIAGDSFELVKDAKIVIISAGIAQKVGQTREELLEKNALIFKQIVPQITKYNKDCILLVVTNPLDVMTYLTYKISEFPPCRVIGSGTVLDTARLRYLLGAEFKISPKDISAYILGEHGDSQFVWWSCANIAGIPLNKISPHSVDFFENIHQKVKNAVYEVISKKGATYYAIALVISKIVRAILLDQSRVFTVSTLLKNYQGISDVCLSVPTVIRENGICQQLEIELDQNELKMFNDCARKIKAEIAYVEKIVF